MRQSLKPFQFFLLLHAFPILLFALILTLQNVNDFNGNGGFYDLANLMTKLPKSWKQLGSLILLELINIFLWIAFYYLYNYFVLWN